jgi:broad specificity phosphatase PhoE
VTQPLVIKLLRHGESEANTKKVDPRDVGDHLIALTEFGRDQARTAGQALGAALLREALVYCSPYLRTRQTLDGVFTGAGVDAEAESICVYEDPRLREIDIGYAELSAQMPLRRKHGWFWYRFAGGESPADCFDRQCTFLESLMRQIERTNCRKVFICTHGMTIRCFVMRFLHLTVEQFEQLDNPDNCDVITIAPINQLTKPVFVHGKYGVEGIRLRK